MTGSEQETGSAKAFSQAGTAEGPGQALPAGKAPQPQQYARPYIADGHAAASPGSQDIRQVSPGWRAGVHGEGPIAQQVRDWRPAAAEVPQEGGPRR